MKRLANTTIIFALALLLSPAMLRAQKVFSSLDTNAIKIGEQVTLTISADFLKETTVMFPQLRDTLPGGIEILGFKGIDSTKKLNYTVKYTLTVFDSGDYVIPSLPVVFRSTGNSDITLMTDSLLLKVITVSVDTTKAIRDIKPIMTAPLTFREVLPYLFIAAGILLLIALFIYYLWRRKQNKPFLPVIKKPFLPPWTIALEKFKEIEKSKLWQNGKIKEYYSEVSDALRSYIENQLNVNAMEMITGDIIEGLKEANVKTDLISKVDRVLTLSDLVKFAKEIPLPDEHAEILSKAREFVLETKPLDETLKKNSSEINNETGK
jgi:hypothetical protein